MTDSAPLTAPDSRRWWALDVLRMDRCPRAGTRSGAVRRLVRLGRHRTHHRRQRTMRTHRKGPPVSSHDRAATAIPAGTATYIDAILAELLFADPSYQRDLDPKRVTKMVSEFDQRLVGVLEVSARGNGRFAILDGQHRWAATCRAHPYRTDAHLASRSTAV
jgi:hypothetical protein